MTFVIDGLVANLVKHVIVPTLCSGATIVAETLLPGAGGEIIHYLNLAMKHYRMAQAKD